MNNYTLTLEFRLSTSDKPIDPDVAVMLNRILSDWHDGRHPFASEMIVEGLQHCLKEATYQACQKRTSEKYGNEMVDTALGCRSSRASIEAYEVFEALRKSSALPHLYSEPKARIERTQ